jgi:hypothetical protein
MTYSYRLLSVPMPPVLALTLRFNNLSSRVSKPIALPQISKLLRVYRLLYAHPVSVFF